MIFSIVLLMLPGKLLDFVAAGFLFIRIFRVEQWIDRLRDRLMAFMQVYNVNSLLINQGPERWILSPMAIFAFKQKAFSVMTFVTFIVVFSFFL